VLRAPVGDTEQFSPDCVAGYEKAFEEAKARGHTVRALVICNPSNPLGESTATFQMLLLTELQGG
jgi:bifunctional pyridoxal-dependent enzyme with beta-cystathionase and maltose regulon repressor activities